MVCGEVDDIASGEAPVVGGGEGPEVAFLAFASDVEAVGGGVGFATASEVARSKSGDCTEHALLTAAMLRVAGIPSRVASGLVFADQFAGEKKVFAYHMWAQALIGTGAEAHWVDLDATLSGQAFDATHLALVVTTLKDGEFESSMAPISKMLGKLRVEVVSAE